MRGNQALRVVTARDVPAANIQKIKLKHHREVVTIDETKRRILNDLVTWYTPRKVAESIGIALETLARVCAGWPVGQRSDVRQKLQAFFAEK